MPTSTELTFVQVTTHEEIEQARSLFEEYAAALGISLCFQNFEHELATLPGKYSPPRGRLFLVLTGEDLVGCVALREIDENVCEMKRLFLRPAFRGKGFGRVMVDAIVNAGREIGYKKMRLDTMTGKMDAAINLYLQAGFKEIPPYYDTPIVETSFLELVLA